MIRLVDTLIRNLNKDKESILKVLEENESMDYTVELQEEEGELLITVLMTDEQIEESAKEAVSKVFPNKCCSDILVKNKYISFKIK